MEWQQEDSADTLSVPTGDYRQIPGTQQPHPKSRHRPRPRP